MNRALTVLTVVVAGCLGLIRSAGAQDADVVMWNQAEVVAVAKLANFEQGPVGQSFPPLYINRLRFDVEKTLRGDGIGAAISCTHPYRAEINYPYVIGDRYIVALSHARDGWTVTRVEPATKELVEQVAAECALPSGWRAENGKIVSPWASLGKDAWDAKLPDNAPAAAPICSVTRRPALLAGKDVVLSIQPVPPVKSIEWTNPDGDGAYTITLSNPTDQPIVVPALLKQNGTVLWRESLVILCQSKSYPIPGAAKVKGDVEFVTLKPGEQISTTLNALALDGPEWPQGGYRIEFTFCLGDKAKTASFYYMSRHHDALRAAAR